MKTNSLFAFMVSILLITAVSCDTAPEPPLPPIVQDCSYHITTPTVDTLEYPPPFLGQAQPNYIYYEGYEITDISFDPNDPNQLVVALEIKHGLATKKWTAS